MPDPDPRIIALFEKAIAWGAAEMESMPGKPPDEWKVKAREFAEQLYALPPPESSQPITPKQALYPCVYCNANRGESCGGQLTNPYCPVANES